MDIDCYICSHKNGDMVFKASVKDEPMEDGPSLNLDVSDDWSSSVGLEKKAELELKVC